MMSRGLLGGSVGRILCAEKCGGSKDAWLEGRNCTVRPFGVCEVVLADADVILDWKSLTICCAR